MGNVQRTVEEVCIRLLDRCLVIGKRVLDIDFHVRGIGHLKDHGRTRKRQNLTGRVCGLHYCGMATSAGAVRCLLLPCFLSAKVVAAAAATRL